MQYGLFFLTTGYIDWFFFHMNAPVVFNWLLLNSVCFRLLRNSLHSSTTTYFTWFFCPWWRRYYGHPKCKIPHLIRLVSYYLLTFIPLASKVRSYFLTNHIICFDEFSDNFQIHRCLWLLFNLICGLQNKWPDWSKNMIGPLKSNV